MATVFDTTRFTQTFWRDAIKAEMETLPSLRRTILNQDCRGAAVLNLPYVSGLTASHVADGTDLTGVAQGGTPAYVSVIVDKHPTTTVLMGKLGMLTSMASTQQRIAQAAASSLLDYESDLIATTIAGATPAGTIPLDLEAAAVTSRQGIGDALAGALGLAAGKLDGGKIRKTNRWVLANPSLVGYAMTTEQFAAAEYVNTLGQMVGPVAGLVSGAPWLGMGIIAHPSITATYTGGGTTHTTTTLYVYQEEAAALAWSAEPDLVIERNPSYNCDQLTADAVMGIAAGRQACLYRIALTLDNNPLNV
jgi:hypothetical protein